MSTIDYTIHGVSSETDKFLRDYAAKESKSLNDAVLETLERGIAAVRERPDNSELRALAGTWVDDPDMNAALAAMDAVDEDAWK